MEVKYSKPSADVIREISLEIDKAEQTRENQNRAVQWLLTAPFRDSCILCGCTISPEVPVYLHRSLDFFFCEECGHFQSFRLPPPGYPMNGNGNEFNNVYPELDQADFVSRRDRIYTPKLEWVLNAAVETGFDRDALLKKKWVELGCGGGYFLDACVHAGVKDVTGIEANEELAIRAKKQTPLAQVIHSNLPLHDSIRQNPAEVYTSFFVFEHVEQVEELYMSFAEKPAGTLLVYAVPVFGFSALVDNLVEYHPARMLDGAVHTQLYTEESINYSLDKAGFDLLAQWVFGADGIALAELLTLEMKKKMPGEQFNKLSGKLLEIIDPIQSAIDRNMFADQRHILAIKR
ncbi:class I SAM-dependent methyltransferase [Calditrichota bacterium]